MSLRMFSDREPGEHTLKDVTEQVMASLEFRMRFPLVTVEGQHVVIFDRFEDGRIQERYYIPKAELLEVEGFAFWMRQLAEKSWVRPSHIELLAQAVLDLIGSKK